VAEYLSGYPRGDAITIRNLLTHTTGIPDYLYLGNAYLTMDGPAALDELVASFSGEELELPPGGRFINSNSGNVLFTKTIETVTGREYCDFIEGEILRPAGMLRSEARCEDDAAKDSRARGYHFTCEGYMPVPGWDSSKAVGAGAITSTAEDLLAWSRALFAGKVLRPASLAALIEPTAASRVTNAMGWYRKSFLERDRVYHGGYIFGFRSDLTIYPSEGVTIVVLSNVDTAQTRRMAEDIAAIIFGAPYEMPAFRTPAPVDPCVYPRYAWTYDTSEVFGTGARMILFSQGDTLWYRSNTPYNSLGQPIHIYPESTAVFFDRTGTARYEFEVGRDGTAEAIVTSNDAESYRFPRVR